MLERLWRCFDCGYEKNPPIAEHCAGCGGMTPRLDSSTRALKLKMIPEAATRLGRYLFCLGETGEVVVVDCEEWHCCDEFTLAPSNVEGLLVGRGLLLYASREEFVAFDLWQRYLTPVDLPDRSRRFQLDGEVASEVRFASPGEVMVIGRAATGDFLHRFELGADIVSRRQSLSLGLPGTVSEGFWGLTRSRERTLIGGGTSLLVDPSGSQRELSFRLRHDGLLAHRKGFLAAGERGELSLLDLETATEKRVLVGPSDFPLFAWGASEEWAVLCHGGVVRAVHLDSQRLHTLELPQLCNVEPVFLENRVLLATDEGSLYVVTLNEQVCKVLSYQPLFLSPGGTRISPLPYKDHLICFGGGGELLRLDIQSREAWTPVSLSDVA